MADSIDIVNERDEVVSTADSDYVHEHGLLHRFVAGFVIDAKGRILLQRRSLSKERGPLLFDSSIGGHVDAGESYDEAIVREAGEELGLPADTPFEFVSSIHDYSPPVENMLGRLYVTHNEGPFSNWENEAERLEWIDVDECAWMLARFHYMFTGGFASAFDAYLKHLSEKQAEQTQVDLLGPKFALAALKAIDEQFPHAHTFIVDAFPDEDQGEHYTRVVRPWLAANAVLGKDYVTSGDPAGFTCSVCFRDRKRFDRFVEACVPS